MSRATWQAPEFRLTLGYPDITLERGGVPLGTAALDAPDIAAMLRTLAAVVARARGTITAILPASEVWRKALPLRARNPITRRLEARDAAAAALGLAPDAVTIALGSPDADGCIPIAAASRETLMETRAFLARSGLAASAIVAPDASPGFAAPPLLWSAGVTSALPSPRAAALAATAASVAMVLGAALLHAPERVASPELVAAELHAPVADSIAPRAPEAQGPLPAALRPHPAPDIRIAAATGVPPVLVTPLRAAEPPLTPQVTLASRSLPANLSQPQPGPAPRPRAPAPPAAAADAGGAAVLDVAAPESMRPMRRPPPATVASPSPAATVVVPVVSEVPDPAQTALARPRARAGAAPSAATASALALAIDAAVQQAGAEAPVVVASLAPVPLAATALGATQPPTPRRLAPAASMPKPAVAKPAVAKPVVAKPVVAKPVVAKPVAPPKALALPAPVRQTRLVTAPASKAATEPARTQTRRQPAPTVASTAATQEVALTRNGVSLIGVFGSANERRALLRMSNGTTRNVRPGDQFQGVQVTSVGPDSVHLRGRGRDTVLQLPD